ncbi:MAG TPA: pseudouridine synthase [Peptococcaceae bacterium]|jgi:23S rRNA pseudouridine2605 synthase|nr:pseudouridine synthase [Peptococcaceae bacterium]HPZ71433.1 pseudouridine synthase [Peptococcaceae bacterium]HQD54526.1 pseudouridine synthase [Peptococcaceae bacterium]
MLAVHGTVVGTLERLQKYLARCGVASRRRAEEMIKQGLVKLNGQVVREMGIQLEPEKDIVEVNGQVVTPKEQKVYLLLNKPVRVVTTLDDPQGRTKVTDFLHGIKERVFPVGRLDYMTEGLLLLTNDGELAYRLTHPRFQIAKTYLVGVRGAMSGEKVAQLAKGVELEDGLTQPAQVKVLKQTKAATLMEITIKEGRNRQIRRMCEKIGHPVQSLKRIAFGNLVLGNLAPGQYRPLSKTEIVRLKILLK